MNNIILPLFPSNADCDVMKSPYQRDYVMKYRCRHDNAALATSFEALAAVRHTMMTRFSNAAVIDDVIMATFPWQPLMHFRP